MVNIAVFSREATEELNKINSHLKTSDIKLSNLDKYINLSVEVSQNISEYWVDGSYDTKKAIQKLVFPDGVYFQKENREYLTERVNELFNLTILLSSDKNRNKKGLNSNKTEKSSLVAGARLERTTFGL